MPKRKQNKKALNCFTFPTFCLAFRLTTKSTMSLHPWSYGKFLLSWEVQEKSKKVSHRQLGKVWFVYKDHQTQSGKDWLLCKRKTGAKPLTLSGTELERIWRIWLDRNRPNSSFSCVTEDCIGTGIRGGAKGGEYGGNAGECCQHLSGNLTLWWGCRSSVTFM